MRIINVASNIQIIVKKKLVIWIFFYLAGIFKGW